MAGTWQMGFLGEELRNTDDTFLLPCFPPLLSFVLLRKRRYPSLASYRLLPFSLMHPPQFIMQHST